MSIFKVPGANVAGVKGPDQAEPADDASAPDTSTVRVHLHQFSQFGRAHPGLGQYGGQADQPQLQQDRPVFSLRQLLRQVADRNHHADVQQQGKTFSRPIKGGGATPDWAHRKPDVTISPIERGGVTVGVEPTPDWAHRKPDVTISPIERPDPRYVMPVDGGIKPDVTISPIERPDPRYVMPVDGGINPDVTISPIERGDPRYTMPVEPAPVKTITRPISMGGGRSAPVNKNNLK